MALTQFGLPVNNVVAAVVAGGYTSGSGVLNLVAGQGAQFGTLGANQFYRITVIQNSVAYSALATPSNFTIFKATGLSTDQFTGVTAIEGTTDRSYVSADVVDVRVTAGSLTDIQTAVNTLEGQYGNQGITAGWSVMSPSYTIVATSGSSVVIPGISFASLPAGTYFITLNCRTQTLLTATSGQTWIITQLHNDTASAFIANTASMQFYNPYTNNAFQSTQSQTYFVALSGASTISLYASQNWSGTGVVSQSNQILSDASGYTSLTYMRVL